MNDGGRATGLDTLADERDGVTIVVLEGDLDAFAVPGFRESLARVPAGTDAVLELSGVAFIDSAGLGALIGAVRRVRDNQGRAMVVCSRSGVVRLLHTTGFDRVAEVYESVDAAIALIARPSIRTVYATRDLS